MRQQWKAWDKQKNCWFKPTYRAYEGVIVDLLLSPSGELAMRTYSEFIHESMFPGRFEIVWGTGLKDKSGNGREMYEGDVYKQDNRHYLIEWSEYSCGWVVRSLSSGSVLPGHLKGEVAVYDDYEYIGSIYEHPHLLEEDH